MTSNIQDSSSQMNPICQYSSRLNQSHNSQIAPNPQSNISPGNRVSVLETAEQKELVRNILEPNNITPVGEPKFTNSNVSFESKPNNVPNNTADRFSFDEPVSDPTFEDRTINVNEILTKENREEGIQVKVTNQNVIAKNVNIKNNALGHNNNNANVGNKKNIHSNI